MCRFFGAKTFWINTEEYFVRHLFHCFVNCWWGPERWSLLTQVLSLELRNDSKLVLHQSIILICRFQNSKVFPYLPYFEAKLNANSPLEMFGHLQKSRQGKKRVNYFYTSETTAIYRAIMLACNFLKHSRTSFQLFWQTLFSFWSPSPVRLLYKKISLVMDWVVGWSCKK